MKQISYRCHRFPPQIIQHAIWLYCRFTLSFRDVEDLLAKRGLEVCYETVRRWVLKFGHSYAKRLRRFRPRPDDRWHLDEMFVKVSGRRVYLWRAVDAEGEVLDCLVQSKRNKTAALKLMRKLLSKDMYLRRSSPTNFLRMGPPLGNLTCLAGTRQDGVRTTGRKIHTSPFDDESARCSASNQPAPRNAFFRSMPSCTTISTSSVI